MLSFLTSLKREYERERERERVQREEGDRESGEGDRRENTIAEHSWSMC